MRGPSSRKKKHSRTERRGGEGRGPEGETKKQEACVRSGRGARRGSEEGGGRVSKQIGGKRAERES